MKFILFFVSIFLFFSNCKNIELNDSLTIDKLLQTIASDEKFDNFMKLSQSIQTASLENKFKLLEIGELHKKYKINHCSVDPKISSEVQGSELYFDLSCKTINALHELKSKYPKYASLKEVEFKKLINIYFENSSYSEPTEMIKLHQFLNK